MDPDRLARDYPEAYHMAVLGSWPGIQRHGLLSTSALLDLFEIQGDERVALESQWRPHSVRIHHPDHGSAVIRDQKPLPEGRLSEILRGVEPEEWYRLINGKVFFWADQLSLQWMLNARAYQDRSHCVLTVDTQRLIEHHLDAMWFTDQNTGSVYTDKPRGPSTFKRVEEFSTPWVKEIAIDYSVPDIVDLTIRVEEWKRERRLRQIWLNESSEGSV